ncbi:MAG: ABC transporter permease [Anaerolineaceae bacterium]|nr:ABC transporter permease [Anaerolineaceae bacterium]
MADRAHPIPEAAPKDIEAIFALRKRTWLERTIGPEWYRLVHGVFTNPLSVTGLVIVGFFLLMALLAPVLAPPITDYVDPYLIPRDGYSPEPKPPGTEWRREPPPVPGWYKSLLGRDEWIHLMGTASGQFDIFYGVVWGTRTALLVGVAITAITVVIGLIVGALSAYYGGWLDDVLMRITEIFLAFPFLLAALTLSAILVPLFGRGIWAAMIALVVFGWMTFARLIRGEIMAAKERDYVLAAEVVGARNMRVLVRHIVPNAIYPVLILASMRIGDYVLSFATLSFLGVGTEIGYADWGQIISFARDWILSLDVHWYIIVYPGAALLLFGLGWNLIGDALRDILDPRLRSSRG